MGILTKKDATLYRGFFKEMAKLRGISVLYQYPVKEYKTIYAEEHAKLSEPIKMDIIFEENPKPKTLKALGWVSEFSDDKPYIAMLPYDAKNITEGCVISISPDEDIRTRTNKFKITNIQALLEFPDCWTCTLAPIFETAVVDNNYRNSNYNYIDCNDQPDKDLDNIVMQDRSYEFLSVDDNE